MVKLIILLMMSIQLVAPDKAPVGSPVAITIKGELENSNTQIINDGVLDSDTLLNLFDADRQRVILFWSNKAGSRKFTVISAVNGDPIPEIYLDSHTLSYGVEPGPDPDPGPNPGPGPIIDKAKVASLVAYVNATPMEIKDLENLTEFFNDMSKVVKETEIKDTAQFRAGYIKAGQEFFGSLGMKDKYIGLSGTIDKIIKNEIGTEIVPLDKIKTSSILSSIAWAFTQ